MNRPDFDAKCSTCGRVYSDHTNDEIDECILSVYPDYDLTLPGLLSIASKEKLAKKWGQPGEDKRVFAIWPLGGGPPVTSTIPTRDFAIFLLCNQRKGIVSDEKGTRKEKKESFQAKKKEPKEDKDAKKEEAEHTHAEEGSK
ncbi:MAG: hypothetical protein ACXACG_15985 [Candidatus Thorarchaeota archaeon]|jgi:hypothetical protein